MTIGGPWVTIGGLAFVDEKKLVKFLELQNLNFYILVAQNRNETN